MGTTGTLSRCRIAAWLSILCVAGYGVSAAAGLAIFPRAASFAVLRAPLAILAVAAIHGCLIAFCMILAAGHLFSVFALAAAGGAVLAMAARLGRVALMIFVIAASAG